MIRDCGPKEMNSSTPKRLHNRYRMLSRRRELRRNLTPAEATLWKALKNSKLSGRKFRRQYSVGRYILDFYCVEKWLAVELDGQVHRNDGAEIYDGERDIYLKKGGIAVLRFENFRVFEEMDYVLHRTESFFGWKSKDGNTKNSPPG